MAYRKLLPTRLEEQGNPFIPVFKHYKCDVLVVGGSSAGTGAALASARLGLDTLWILRSPRELGGLTTNAVNPDSDLPIRHLGGIPAELDAVARYTTGFDISGFYGEGYFAPLFHWYEYLRREADSLTSLTILADFVPAAVTRDPAKKRIREVHFLHRKRKRPEIAVKPRIVIDAEIEADTTHLAGVSTTLKREAKHPDSDPTRNAESFAGHLFSKLVPEESLSVAGGPLLSATTHDADTKPATVGWTGEILVKEYGYGDLDSPWVLGRPPAGYRKDDFEWITPDHEGRYTLARFGAVPLGHGYWRWRAEENLSWIEGWQTADGDHVLETQDVDQREEVEKAHLRRSICGLYHLQHALGRLDVGLSDRDFCEDSIPKYTLADFDTSTRAGNAPLPSAVYMREGRRLVNDCVFGSALIESSGEMRYRKTYWSDRSVAFNAMLIDLHGVHKESVPGSGPEGMYIPRFAGADAFNYPCLPIDVLIPRPDEIDALLVPAAAAFTHVAMNAFPRQETGRLVFGAVAAATAFHALADNVAVADVNVGKIQHTLLEEFGQSIVYFDDTIPGTDWFRIDQFLGARGIPRQNVGDDIYPEDGLTISDTASFVAEACTSCRSDAQKTPAVQWITDLPGRRDRRVLRGEILTALSLLLEDEFELSRWAARGFLLEESLGSFRPEEPLPFSEFRNHLFNVIVNLEECAHPIPVDLRPIISKDTFSRPKGQLKRDEMGNPYVLSGDWWVMDQQARPLIAESVQDKREHSATVTFDESAVTASVDIFLEQRIGRCDAGLWIGMNPGDERIGIVLAAEGPLVRVEIHRRTGIEERKIYEEAWNTTKRGFNLQIETGKRLRFRVDRRECYRICSDQLRVSAVSLTSNGDLGNRFDNLFVRRLER